ncbi:uracil-DNA glycosylase [Domibacillus antri]|uniref:Uracil-DNA glycosylase n=1 Tax=Domibacillus antri TaxID=1714264 RepID=A0A1Q8Q434_9BACI|nr:uracil-DNA glycosylase [Domibacillus antri]OLN22055.1 uracil-DNA glycosylase [Domibacillus antri]
MRIPDELAELGKKRIAAYQVEGFVYGSGPEHAKLMLVGEAPGETEIGNGIPFSGRAGNELMKFLQLAGVTREDVYITSAVRSRPYKWGEKNGPDGTKIKRKYNRAPTAGEIKAHAPLLDYEMEHVKAPVIVTLGNIGLKRLAGKDKKVSDLHGRLLIQPVLRLKDDQYEWTDKKYCLFPTFHPASIFYNRGLLELIHSDMEKLRGLLGNFPMNEQTDQDE